MMNNASIDTQIYKLRQVLEYTAEQHEFNFRHPKVLQISEQLDDLIILVMKDRVKAFNYR